MKEGKNMNQNKVSKIIISIIVFLLICCVSVKVFADENSLLDLNSIAGGTTDNNVDDLSNSLGGGNTEKPENTPAENTQPENKVPDITPTNTPTNTNKNTSTYEESNIPYAGVESSILMVTAFIVLGIIGVYTFIKLSDYNNI